MLLVPPVRRFASARFGRAVRRRAEAAGLVYDARVSSVTTVQGDVVREDDRPVRGEIISGEIVPEPPDDSRS